MSFWKIERPRSGECQECGKPLWNAWAWRFRVGSHALCVCHECFSDVARDTQEMACTNPLILAREMLGKEWENIA